jgi:hypothetical protein
MWIYPKREKVYSFFRMYTGSPVTSSTTTETDFSIVTSFNQLPDFTEFTALFDAYRIRLIRYIFTPRPLEVQTGTTPRNDGMFICAPDHDDGNPTSFTQLQEYPGAQVVTPGQYFERVVSPSPNIAAYSGVFTSFARAPNSTWIDAGSPGVIYYGLKYAITTTTIAQAYWDIQIQVLFECTNVR